MNLLLVIQKLDVELQHLESRLSYITSSVADLRTSLARTAAAVRAAQNVIERKNQ